MIYKYNPEDQNFRPVTILELLHQEYSLPSDFKNAYQKLISDIRKEQEKRRQRFIDIAAKVLNCPVDQVKIRARKIYQKKVLEDRRAEIERMKTAVVRFKMTAQHAETLRKLRQERPEANINIKPEEYDTECHTMIVKGTRSFLPEEIENEKDMALDYSEKKGEEASDRDLFNALRVQDMSNWAKLSQEEIALEQAWGEWEKVFGDGNILEVEMKGKYPEVLNLDAGSNEEADRFQEVGKKVVEGGRKGAEIASHNSEKNRRRDQVLKRYGEIMNQPHKLRETEVKKQLTKEFRVSRSTIYRYLQDR